MVLQGPWGLEHRFARQAVARPWPRRMLDGLVCAAMTRIERRSVATAQRVFVASEHSRSRLTEVIGGGADSSRFHPSADRAAIRRERGLGEVDFLFLAVRRLDPRMGLGQLVDGFAQVSAASPRARLWIAGKGAQRDELRRRRAARAARACGAARLRRGGGAAPALRRGGLRDHAVARPGRLRIGDRGIAGVRHAGHRVAGRREPRAGAADADLPCFFQACDIFVFPTVAPNEAFGLVQVEAMACGKPVVACTLRPGVPWVCANGVTGLTVPPGESVALALALRRLLGEKSLGVRLGEAGRWRAHEEFASAVRVERYRSLFARLRGPVRLG